MPSLREWQREVMRCVLAERDSAVPWQLQIYANNLRTNFANALQASYPVTRRLVGDAYFHQCAMRFLGEQPSRSGDLHLAGARFADCLQALHRGGEFRYLHDVARLEWLCQETLLSMNHEPLDLNKLKLAPSESYDALVFKLHPALRLFESEFPCLTIWQANSRAEEPQELDLAAGGDRLALMRFCGELIFHPLSPAEWCFLSSLRMGATFVSAVAAARAGGDFGAAAALKRFVRNQVIVDFSLAPDDSPDVPWR